MPNKATIIGKTKLVCPACQSDHNKYVSVVFDMESAAVSIYFECDQKHSWILFFGDAPNGSAAMWSKTEEEYRKGIKEIIEVAKKIGENQ
jgi:hypothetical protein